MTSIVRADPWGFFDLAPSLLKLDWGNGDASSMRVEHYMDGETLVVRAEMPGIDPEKDVSITLSNGMLRIEAHRSESQEHQDKDSYRSEFRYGSFLRELRMPPEVRENDIEATYVDGVLTVRVPIPAAKQQVTSIPVSRGKSDKGARDKKA